VGVLIGRGHRAEPTSEDNAPAVQITTAPPPITSPITPLPSPVVPTPPPAAIPKIAPDAQVQEDAAAVGMTTREEGDAGVGDAAPKPKSAAAHGDETGEAQPAG
jgi:hypothetical protein